MAMGRAILNYISKILSSSCHWHSSVETATIVFVIKILWKLSKNDKTAKLAITQTEHSSNQVEFNVQSASLFE